MILKKEKKNIGLIMLIQRELNDGGILNFQVPAEGLELVILLHTQY